MKTLITGGAGFIGSHLADFLIKLNHEVTVIDNLSIGRLENINHLIGKPGFNFLEADILNFESINNAFKNIDWVFHLAALADIVPSIEKPADITASKNVSQPELDVLPSLVSDCLNA